MQPTEGKIHLAIDATIENISEEDLAVSSLMSFELKDAEGRKQDFTINTEASGSLDGTVLPGEKLTGEIVYEVAPEGELNMYYESELLSGTPIK